MGLDVEIIKDSPSLYTITVTLPPGVTLSGKSLTFTVKTDLSVPDSTNLFQKTSPSGGISIISDFTAQITVNAADTASLTNLPMQYLVYTLTMTDGGNIYPISEGIFAVTANPTEAVLA